jgi:hypothetical protein
MEIDPEGCQGAASPVEPVEKERNKMAVEVMNKTKIASLITSPWALHF